MSFKDLLEEAAGFPLCGVCAFRDTGFPSLCFACASHEMEPIDEEGCIICDQTLMPNGECRNTWCAAPVDERHWDYVWAIAKNTGRLRSKIHDYKYQNRHGWAQIFGRVIVGFLDMQPDAFDEYDLIVSVPEFLTPPRTYSPVALMLKKAALESGDRWPFDTEAVPAIVKERATTSMMDAGSLSRRREVARTEIRESLNVPRPDRISGKRVLVVDDVFTEGSTLREVARSLKLVGAEQVSGLVLARQPWLG